MANTRQRVDGVPSSVAEVENLAEARQDDRRMSDVMRRI